MQPLPPFIQQVLRQGETVLWSGRPRQGLKLRPADAFVIPFSLVWCGFIFFWEMTALKKGAPVFFVLWGLPFVLVGLFMLFGRFFVDSKIRAGTLYAITNERIMIVSGIFSRQTRSLPLRTLSDISLTQRSDRSGTITFGPLPIMAYRYPSGIPGFGNYSLPAFDMIEDAGVVYEILMQAQKTPK